MIAKESANQMAEAIIDAAAMPMRRKQRERLERRYISAFGEAYVSRCLANPSASELAIRKTRGQWQLALLLGCSLMAFIVSMHFDQASFGIIAIVYGGVFFLKLSVFYARRHFDAVDT
ncbi:MAG: hypothetical protein AAGG55_11190 [Pseudomonadota bacterium]